MILSKLPRRVASAFIIGLLILGITACGLGGPSKAERLGKDMHDAAMSVPGVTDARLHVNMNTSGNFITASLTGTGTDQSELSQALGKALPAMLEKTKDLDNGSFSVSIFSPDDSVSVGSDALGYTGTSSLVDFREYFLNQP
ncbi:hypothetical protein [Paenarthrobacter nitroguajacolicus]|uniref:hypothetical protein n=1 Tax=Paenarthrobacter nitroguajacolicus TaxID=211146 RepID=UPI00248D3644|nr:hypothetical protein [Paenarthrobacter nitroguajacolicus]MDI2034853.1 hypothetical protein [Paenarthrobacter nitroguajacolicus]